MTIAFGPKLQYPSWEWVGADTAEELRKYYTVITYDADELPQADVIFVIKRPLTLEQVAQIKANGSYLIYVPIDFFYGQNHLQKFRQFLVSSDIIVSHSASLAPFLHHFAPTRLIDHHGKFFLPNLASYKEKGFAIWIGGFEHLPFLLHYLDTHEISIDIQILTNVDNMSAQRRAKRLAQELGTDLRLEDDRIRGMPIIKWAPEIQAAMLREAKAAIDIKGSSFNQRHKPATKAQKFICSGVPLAMEPCESVTYFARHGLQIPTPSESKWLTRDYYTEVTTTASQLRPLLTIEAIGQQYQVLIDELVNS